MLGAMIAVVGGAAVTWSAGAFSQPGVDDHAVKVVEAKTPVWRSPRELLVMLDEAHDRVAFARSIINTSLTSTELSDEQRYDGLRVAGNSLFHDEQYAEAVSALSSAADFTIDPAEQAEVVASAAQANMAGLGDRETGLALSRRAADLYKRSDPTSLDKMMVDSTFRAVVSLAYDQQEYAVSHDYAIDAIGLSAQLPHGGLNLGYYRYTAAIAAQKMGDSARAASLFGEFLEHHPTYLNNQPSRGIVPHAKVQKALAEGSSWEKPDERLINTVLEILRNPEYAKMSVRVNFAERLAYAWDKMLALDASMALRSEIASLTQPELDALDPNNPAEARLGRDIWVEFAVSQTNGGAFLVTRDPARAVVFLDRVLAPSPFARPDLVESAQAFRDRIAASPE